jgi:hypothetical protein
MQKPAPAALIKTYLPHICHLKPAPLPKLHVISPVRSPQCVACNIQESSLPIAFFELKKSSDLPDYQI